MILKKEWDAANAGPLMGGGRTTNRWQSTTSEAVGGGVGPDEGRAELPDLDRCGGDCAGGGVVEEEDPGGAVDGLRRVHAGGDAGPPSLGERLHYRVIHLRDEGREEEKPGETRVRAEEDLGVVELLKDRGRRLTRILTASFSPSRTGTALP